MSGTAELEHVAERALPFAVAKEDFDAQGFAEYAALRALCAVYPNYIDDMNGRYRLADEAARRALDETWQSRLASHPREKRLFDILCDLFEDWIRRYSHA